MDKDHFSAVLYLYNGGGQPEVRTVNSVEQMLQYAADFTSARLERPGQPPVWVKPKKKPNGSADNTSLGEDVPERSVRTHIGPSVFFDGWRPKKIKLI